MRTETWKPIPGYEGLYEVSDRGRVRNVTSGLVLRDFPHRQGYRQVKLYHNHVSRTLKVHRLVLEAFVGPCPEGMVACHRNDVKTDNRLENLRWDTRSANQLDRVRNGTYTNGRESQFLCKRGHKLVLPNLRRSSWEKRGIRNCLSCDRASAQIRNGQVNNMTLQELSDIKYTEIMH